MAFPRSAQLCVTWRIRPSVANQEGRVFEPNHRLRGVCFPRRGVEADCRCLIIDETRPALPPPPPPPSVV